MLIPATYVVRGIRLCQPLFNERYKDFFGFSFPFSLFLDPPSHFHCHCALDFRQTNGINMGWQLSSDEAVSTGRMALVSNHIDELLFSIRNEEICNTKFMISKYPTFSERRRAVTKSYLEFVLKKYRTGPIEPLNRNWRWISMKIVGGASEIASICVIVGLSARCHFVGVCFNESRNLKQVSVRFSKFGQHWVSLAEICWSSRAEFTLSYRK